MRIKNIIRPLAALMLTVIMTLSLSSCVFDFSFGEYVPDFEYDGDFGEGLLPDLEGGGDDEITSENYGEFYPGSGTDSLDGLDPLSKTLLSTVTIVCGSGLSSSAGSGVIYSVDREKGDAYILTNCHVVYGSQKTVSNDIKVYLYGMELESYAIPASFVGGSVSYDIAILKITSSEVIKNSYATAVALGDSEAARAFDTVYAVGNAEGAGISVTEGIISVPSENISLSGADGSLVSLRVMRIDAAVNHGNSGGGLYDENGRLIGIVSAKEVSEDIDNMGYAIPSNLAISLAKSIIDQCDGKNKTQITKPLIGITITYYVSGVKIDEGGKVYQVKLVEVTQITEGSLAEGKIQVGDVINSITVDGVKTEVTRVHHVTDSMIGAKVGSSVVINITRGENNIDITLTVPESAITTVK